MEIIYELYYDTIGISSYTIYNDMLYIIGDNYHCRLMCIDLKRRYLVYDKFICIHIYDKIYIHNDMIYKIGMNKLKYIPLNGEHYYDSREVIKLIIINNEENYIIKNNDLYILIDKNNNELLKIKLDENIRFENNILYIPFIENMHCESYNDNIIFYYLNGYKVIKFIDINDNIIYITFNINTKKLKFNKDLKINQFISPDKVIHEKDKIKYIYDIINDINYEINDIFPNINEKINDYHNDVDISTFLGGRTSIYYIDYKNKKYCICLTYENYGSNLTILEGNLINIVNEKYIKQNYIKIGTIENNVEINLELLVNNSKHINDLYNDFNENININLIGEGYKYIDIYKNYKENGEIDVNNYEKLFYICNYLIDKDIDIVCDIIIKYVTNNKIDINESFKFLELFLTSICGDNLNILLVCILKKYTKSEIKNQLKLVSRELYNFISNEMITMLLNDFEFIYDGY